MAFQSVFTFFIYLYFKTHGLYKKYKAAIISDGIQKLHKFEFRKYLR